MVDEAVERVLVIAGVNRVGKGEEWGWWEEIKWCVVGVGLYGCGMVLLTGKGGW